MRSLANEQDCAEIRGRLRALQPGDVRQWGQMSVNEMLCHVHGAFRTAMGELELSGVVPAQPLPPRLLKFLALRVPMTWPKGVPTIPELKLGGAEMCPAGFEEERGLAMGAMERFLQPGQRLGDHAIFGTMTRGDWMRWGYLHSDHHLRQFGR
jgi:hypothetical protein